ncbi:MFS transporter [Neisseria sp. Ec49-e6-T10]|uniref:MFS transporter n=1 Tax=Neisseria sp. Ec49-e6-T10 TaxID=3140744 RepID=UPI003EBAB8E8
MNHTSAPPSPIVYKMLPWITAMALFMQSLDATVLNTALPAIAKDFQRSPLSMQSAIISYALTVALLIPISGFLADKFGTKKVFITAVSLFSIGSLLCALSASLDALVVSRIIQGIGGAMMMPVARLAMIKTFDRSDLLAAINFSTIPGLIGPVLGPLVGGYLVHIASWHWVFIINIPIGIIGIYCGLKYMPDFEDSSEHFDFLGFVLFSLSIVMVSLGLEFVSEGNNYLFSLTIALLGILLMYLYTKYAKQAEYPIFSLSLFKVRTFMIGLAGSLASRIGLSSLPLLIPLLMQVIFAFSPAFSGWMLVPMALASVTMKTMVTPILKKFGYRKTLMGNTIFAGIGIMLLAIPNQHTPVIVWVILLALIGAVNSLQFTSMNTIVLADLQTEQASSGNSLVAVNQQLAISFGIAVGAALVHLLSLSSWLTNDGQNLHTAFRVSFVLLGLSTILSSLIFAKLKDHDGDNLFHK